ncbi:MAG: hypothetical protein WBD57_03515 [Candidatus Cybelea sp.]
MAILVRALVLGIAVSAGSTVAGLRPASAAAELPPALSALVGNWNCTYTGPKGTSKSTYAISKLNDLWIDGTGDTSASLGRPANKSFFSFGYDPKKHVFITLGGSSIAGDYGASTAYAAEGAMTMTYTASWPADPSHERDVWHITPSAITIASSWTEKGKPMSGKGSCTKQ